MNQEYIKLYEHFEQEYKIKLAERQAQKIVDLVNSFKLNKTKLSFDMIKSNEDYHVDPNSIYINGHIPFWGMLEEFLFQEEDSVLSELIENMESEKTYRVDLEIWVDFDDFRSWIDFNVLNVELI